MKKWAKIAIVVVASLIFIWVLTFFAVAKDNGYSLQVALYSCEIVCAAAGITSFLYFLVWCGINWIEED